MSFPREDTPMNQLKIIHSLAKMNGWPRKKECHHQSVPKNRLRFAKIPARIVAMQTQRRPRRRQEITTGSLSTKASDIAILIRRRQLQGN